MTSMSRETHNGVCYELLSEGRYTWRHNRVLEVLVETIADNLPDQAENQTVAGAPAFVKEESGEVYRYHKRAPPPNQSVLAGACDWQLCADLPELRNYPQAIKKTNMRPDAVLFSESLRQIIMIELTVPYENRIDHQHQYKTSKYSDIAPELQKDGLRSKVLAVEVGARGFVGTSMYTALTQLGVRGRKQTKAMKLLAEKAEQSSSWLWSKQNEKWT